MLNKVYENFIINFLGAIYIPKEYRMLIQAQNPGLTAECIRLEWYLNDFRGSGCQKKLYFTK